MASEYTIYVFESSDQYVLPAVCYTSLDISDKSASDKCQFSIENFNDSIICWAGYTDDHVENLEKKCENTTKCLKWQVKPYQKRIRRQRVKNKTVEEYKKWKDIESGKYAIRVMVHKTVLSGPANIIFDNVKVLNIRIIYNN